MPRNQEQAELHIVPPIIFSDGGDVQAYPSIEALTRDIEVVDLIDERCELHDSTGRALEARVSGGKVAGWRRPFRSARAVSGIKCGFRGIVMAIPT